MPEVWKRIPKHRGYEASSFGRIRSFVKQKSLGQGRGTKTILVSSPHLLKLKPDFDGYVLVSLGRKAQSKKVHQLVLLAFGKKRRGRPHTRHINGKRNDNALTNIAWSTVRENKKDADRHGTTPKGSLHWKTTLTEKQVVNIRNRVKRGKRGVFARLADKYGVSLSVISNIVHRVRWKHC